MDQAPMFQRWFLWTRAPVICNGPMLGAVSPALATEVSKAGGIGTGHPFAFRPNELVV